MPSRLGRSRRLKGFFHLPTARKTTSAASSRTPAASTSIRILSMVSRTRQFAHPAAGPPAVAPGSRPIRSTTAAPWLPKPFRQPRSARPAGAHSLPHGSRHGVQFQIFFKKGRIRAEVHADVPVGLVAPFVKERPKARHSHQPRPRAQRGSSTDAGRFSSSHRLQPIWNS